MSFLEKKEKKAGYLEHIYDLIFVYMLGKSNALIHNFDNGFVNLSAFLVYAICTLAIIQIWNYTTFYMNMFGRNSARDHIFLCTNMYLLYFIGESTNTDWQSYQTQYHIVWGLILINIAAQYFIEYRNHKSDAYSQGFIKRIGITLIIEAALVFAATIPEQMSGIMLSLLAIVSGILLTVFGRRKGSEGQVDFAHLTERAMLFVVFTFGEMIIAVGSYFINDGGSIMNIVYFSLMAFLIVVGLFLCYGLVFDRFIDREGNHDAVLYMAAHIFLIFFMNNITASLEFMREEEVSVLPKMIFLIISIVGFFAFLFSLMGFAKPENRPSKKYFIIMAAATAVFAALMIILRELMYINIFLTVVYVFSMFLSLFFSRKKLTSEKAFSSHKK